jgi:hypothetical protein
MLESDWLLSHVVLFIPHGRQTNTTRTENSRRVKQVRHVAFPLLFGLGAKVFYDTVKTMHHTTKIVTISESVEKNYIDYIYRSSL